MVVESIVRRYEFRIITTRPQPPMKMIIAGGNLRTWPKTLGRNSYDICGQKGVMRPDITYGQTGTILGMCYVSSLRLLLLRLSYRILYPSYCACAIWRDRASFVADHCSHAPQHRPNEPAAQHRPNEPAAQHRPNEPAAQHRPNEPAVHIWRNGIPCMFALSKHLRRILAMYGALTVFV